MRGDANPQFNVYFGGTFQNLEDGSTIYSDGLSQSIVVEAKHLFKELEKEIPVPMYKQRVWYKLPFENLNELKLLWADSGNFERLCETTTWIKVIDVYMESNNDAQTPPPEEDPRVINEADNTEECAAPSEGTLVFEEDARVEAVIAEIDDDSEPEGLPTSPNVSDNEEDATAYEGWVKGSGELRIRQVFTSMEEFKEAVLDYALKGGWNIKYSRWGKVKSEAICAAEGEHNCKWRIYCSYEESVDKWLVKTFYDTHSCIKDGRCSILTDNVIAKLILNDVRLDPKLQPMAIQADIEERYNLIPTHDQCRNAKRKALDIIRKEFDEQYSKIKDYAIEIKSSNPGSTVELRTEMVDGPLEVFERFYVCYASLRTAWLECARPVIGIDGCFLKDGTKRQLLAVVGRDANNCVYPIAWAIVKVENEDNWKWFISKLKEDLLLGSGAGITLISDRQKGLLLAVEAMLPAVEHRMCARHIYGNIKRDHPNKGKMKKLFWEVAHSYTQADYEEGLKRMKEYDVDVYDSLMKRNPRNCSRAFFKTESTCEDALNNNSESYNSTLEKARRMPLVEMLETVRRQAMVRIEMRRKKSIKHQGKFTPRVGKLIKMEEEFRKYCKIFPGPTGMFEVLEKGTPFKVNMTFKTCTCRRWDLTGVPCRHALRVILDKKLNAEDYVSKFFLTSVWQKQYSFNITPLVGMKFWIASGEPTIKAPAREVHRGRSKKTTKRIKGVHESPTRGKKVTSHGRTMHCGRCGGIGHYRSSCKNARDDQPPDDQPPNDQQEKTQPRKRRKKNTTEAADCLTLGDGEGPSQPTQDN